MKSCFLAAFVLVAAPALHAQSLSDVQRSHVEANVPSSPEFDALMRRDLLAYFRSAGFAADDVQYDLLRTAPTQSGVAYPKFYSWVRVLSKQQLVVEGALRVAAVERKRFEVTNFLSKESVQVSPSEVGQIFPAALAPAVHSRAGIK